ncbi:MAG: MBL fold metallo-hydrolase, partial [Halobacteriaceae archaeon]
MRVTLLGTGDTTGTPTPNCQCETCKVARETDVERSRFSLLIENERLDKQLLIDASPDFRSQFLNTASSLPDEAIITHIHFDHLDGLGNVYRLLDSLTVHASGKQDPITGESVAETISKKYDYLDRIHVDRHDPLKRFKTCGFDVRLLPVTHPPLDCYGVSIEEPKTGKKVAITGDTSYDIPSRTREHLSDADLFLADAIVPASACN